MRTKGGKGIESSLNVVSEQKHTMYESKKLIALKRMKEMGKRELRKVKR